VKKSKMEANAIKELLYGGIRELMSNRNYYYHSNVGQNYCHWTESGQKAVAEYINLVGYKIIEIEEARLNQRAKDLVIKGLKGESI